MTKLTDEIPTVVRYTGLAMQVCVPKTFTDKQVVEFAEKSHPNLSGKKWNIRREGSEYLAGDPERVTCEELPNHVHIMLDL